MSVQPVEISKAYRLLQVGSTTMISAKYDGVENVMSAAWVGLAGERGRLTKPALLHRQPI